MSSNGGPGHDPDPIRKTTPITPSPTVIAHVQADVDACRAAGLLEPPAEPLIPKWQQLVATEPERFVRSDGTLNEVMLRQFRRDQIFVPDVPMWDPQTGHLKNLLGGGRRGDRRMVKECLELVRRSPYEPLLRKYPCSRIGQPYVFQDGGYVYTYRWLKHIWSLGLIRDVLGAQIQEDFVGLDIGSSYGIFSGLVKHEWPRSHHVLVDFPQQLFLARYFLGCWHPDARIAGAREVLEQPTLTRDWVEQYDFVLVPCTRYGSLAGGSVDLVSNFASFGEMTRKWFETYVYSDPVEAARYLFLINRVESAPTYDTDLTVLDYPIWGTRRRLHFAVSQPFSRPLIRSRHRVFFSGSEPSHPYFEYIGERVNRQAVNLA